MFRRDYHAGSDTVLNSITLPGDMWIEGEDRIRACRRCGKRRAIWPPNTKVHSQSAVLAKLMDHEKYCAGKEH